MSYRCQFRRSAKCHFLILVEQKERPPRGGLSKSNQCLIKRSLERLLRRLIGAIEGSARFRQSSHECGP